MLRISRKTDYGLLLLAYLARQESQRLVSLTEIAHANHLPLPYLRQVAQKLHKANIISSKEGVTGGYTLSKPAEAITVAEVVAIFEKKFAPVACLDPNDSCRAEGVCTTQRIWKTLYGDMLKTFQQTTIQSFI